jgi:hypothetical protein
MPGIFFLPKVFLHSSLKSYERVSNSIIFLPPEILMAESELTYALVATNLNHADAQIDTGDIHYAIVSQF